MELSCCRKAEAHKHEDLQFSCFGLPRASITAGPDTPNASLCKTLKVLGRFVGAYRGSSAREALKADLKEDLRSSHLDEQKGRTNQEQHGE